MRHCVFVDLCMLRMDVFCFVSRRYRRKCRLYPVTFVGRFPSSHVGKGSAERVKCGVAGTGLGKSGLEEGTRWIVPKTAPVMAHTTNNVAKKAFLAIVVRPTAVGVNCLRCDTTAVLFRCRGIGSATGFFGVIAMFSLSPLMSVAPQKLIPPVIFAV